MRSVDQLSEDETSLWHAWKRATETVRARVAADISAATGLSDPDFGILTRLADADDDGVMRQNELAASMSWHRSRLSHQLTRMEQRGLVTRAVQGDGVAVRFTPAGRDAAAAARPVHASSVRRHLTRHVSPDRLRELVAILDALSGVGGSR
jgi:DNA-binding MarR family transcriptional regulator